MRISKKSSFRVAAATTADFRCYISGYISELLAIRGGRGRSQSGGRGKKIARKWVETATMETLVETTSYRKSETVKRP